MPASHPRRPPRLRLEPLEGRDVPAVITVTAFNDVDDYDPADPANWAGPNGELSLPEAIREANAQFGGAIQFAVPAVTLTRSLPAVTVPVTVTGLLNGARPGTTINGAGLADGMTLTVGGTVHNLVVQNFVGSYGMSIAGTADVENCYFGTTVDGSAAAGNAGAGLVIKGGTVSGCLFSGNAGDGLRVTGTATVEGNFFGTDPSGLVRVPNRDDGLVLTGPGSVVHNNVLSGNGANGLSIEGALAVGNKVLGNKIGVGGDGRTAVPNQVGVFVGTGARGTGVGGVSSFDQNVISGNTSHGVWLERAGINNTILGNWIGVAATGTQALPNGGNGVFIHSTGSAVVGGTAAGAGNVIAANGGAGVRIEGVAGQLPATRANKVQGNRIGLDTSGNVLGNAGGGVVIAGGAAANTVGGTVLAARNVISGNAVAGITLTDAATTGNLVQGNFIGTDVLGTSARPNDFGVQIVNGASTNTVGGGTAAARNVISGNSKAGVYVAGVTTKTNRVLGNFIGTTPDGKADLGNAAQGIRLDGAWHTTVGGASAGARNVISGNTGDGVAIAGVARDGQTNVVSGNYIGVDVTGAVALGNGGAGVSVAGGDKNRIGGSTAGQRNVISANAQDGVDVESGATGTSVLGNYIGTDLTGKIAVPNQVGVVVEAGTTLTTVGGSTRALGNVISGNTGDGVRLFAPASVRNNLIGTDRAGTVVLGNQGQGVFINASGTAVGGPGLGNVIANNMLGGVVVQAGTGNKISCNRIFNNNGLGISIWPGANNNISPPSIRKVLASALTVSVTGTVFGAPVGPLRLELFASQQPDPSFQGEGALYRAGVNNVRTDANGNFTATFATSIPAGYHYLTLTVTDGSGDTSGFSFVFQL